MLAECLEELIGKEDTSAAELARVGQVHVCTISRVVTDEVDTRVSIANRWMVGLKSPKARRAIANAMLEGTGMFAVIADTNLDVNGDGKIDVLDAVEATGAAIRHLAPEIEALVAAMQSGGRVPATMPTAFLEQASEAITCIKQAIAVMQQLPTETERRKARQPGDAGETPLKIVGTAPDPARNKSS